MFKHKKKSNRKIFIEKFWQNKKVILQLSDNLNQWIFYLIQETLPKGIEYRLFYSNGAMLDCIDSFYNDFIKKSNNLKLIIKALCTKIKYMIKDEGILPLTCNIWSKNVYYVINKYVLISNLNTNLENMCYEELFFKKIKYSFNIFNLKDSQ